MGCKQEGGSATISDIATSDYEMQVSTLCISARVCVCVHARVHANAHLLVHVYVCMYLSFPIVLSC